MTWNNPAYAIALQCTPRGGPVPCVVSHPGNAKTAWHECLARHLNRHFVQLILRQMMPEDIKGVPSPGKVKVGDDSYDGVNYLLGNDMLVAKHGKCVVLLDELNHAGHDVLGAAQEWINNPPENSLVGAAMNPVESSTSGVELAPPVVNRMCILEWERPIESRRAGWRNGFKDYPMPDFPVVPDDFLSLQGPFWGDLMCEFELDNMDLFGDDAYPKDPNQACDPWPSDRSWTHVGILMAACDTVGAPNGIKEQLVRGCVGKNASYQFMRWLLNRDLPDYEEILAVPSSLKLSQRYDISRAILTGVIGSVQAHNTPSRWEAACDVITEAATQQMEHAASVFGHLMKAKPPGYMPKDRNGVFAELRGMFLTDK